MSLTTLLSITLGLGCGSAGSDDSADTTAQKDEADTDTDTDADSDADPQAIDDMVRNADACQNVGGSPDTEAAQVWYWGAFADPSGTASGQEAWYYFVNDAWKAAGGEDCVVVWDVVADESDDPACANCSWALDVTAATINTEATTCPMDAYTDYDPTSEAYELRLEFDGTTTWYLPSGTQFAAGWWGVHTFDYLADGGCEVRSF